MKHPIEDLMHWLHHHFIMPDPILKARRDLAETRMELFKAHENAERTMHTLVCLSQREERLANLCEDKNRLIGGVKPEWLRNNY